MEEIDLKELFLYLWNKKVFIIICAFIGIVVGIVYTKYLEVPLYQSYTTILLTKEKDSTAITSSDVALNKNLVDTYREIIKSRNVLSKVITNLNLSYTVDELSKMVTVESVNDTEIIKVKVVNEDSYLSMNIADEIATVFKTEIVKLYNIQNVGIIDSAMLPKKPYNINLIKTTLLTTLISLVFIFGICFILFYFDTTIKNGDEIERKLGLTVIGNIPILGGK